MSKLLFALVTVTGLLFKGTNPYSMGAPDQACKRMTPGHGFDPQVNTNHNPNTYTIHLQVLLLENSQGY